MILGDLGVWTCESKFLASCTPFGSGCAGSAGEPLLRSRLGSLPWIGATFDVVLEGVDTGPGAALPVLVLGESKTVWNGLGLPLDLGPYGMPTCSLLSSIAMTFPFTKGNGSARWSCGIPAAGSLVGYNLFMQGIVASSDSNPLGLVTSNACSVILGTR